MRKSRHPMLGSARSARPRALSLAWAAAALAVVVAASCSSSTKVVSPGLAFPEGDVERGKEAFVRLECVACHEVAGHPDLPAPRQPVPFRLGEGTASRPTDGRLVTALINPHHTIRDPHHTETVTESGRSRMTDYADVMKVRELIDLVAFLRSAYWREGAR